MSDFSFWDIGLIKRTQRVFGRIFTVSGVVVAFRRAALDRVDYWSTDRVVVAAGPVSDCWLSGLRQKPAAVRRCLVPLNGQVCK